MNTKDATCTLVAEEPLADGHCHLQDCRFDSEHVHEILTDKTVSYIVVNGCCPDDWSRVAELWKAYPQVILPQFGLHPWWVSKQSGCWLEELKRVLEEHPSAGLGECGLDKSGRWASSFTVQKEAFAAQIQLALSLRRPLSIHCVKAYGHILEHLSVVNGRVPVLLHGWAGSAEMTQMFAKHLKNVYFSINLGITRLDPIRASQMLNDIPPELYILESDGPDGVLSKDRWAVWCSSLPQLQSVAKALDHRIAQAHEQGHPSNIILVAHIVGALTHQCPKSIMATSVANITKIFA